MDSSRRRARPLAWLYEAAGFASSRAGLQEFAWTDAAWTDAVCSGRRAIGGRDKPQRELARQFNRASALNRSVAPEFRDGALAAVVIG
jgi:hypothetical protein